MAWATSSLRSISSAAGITRHHSTVDEEMEKLLVDEIRIALLHLAPRPGEVAHNRQLVEAGIAIAAAAGAQCILTPELATTGYSFIDCIGTEWITPQPDDWSRHIASLAGRHRVAILLAQAERDEATNTLHNIVFAISSTGVIVGRHRKINTLRVGSEAWSTPGLSPTIVQLGALGKFGILICADACSPEIASEMKRQGARLLLSSAAWAPGLHGPSGEWEQTTQLTGLPLFVCNRTGKDAIMSFEMAESVVVHRGQRLLSMVSERSVAFVFDWNIADQRLRSVPLRFDVI